MLDHQSAPLCRSTHPFDSPFFVVHSPFFALGGPNCRVTGKAVHQAAILPVLASPPQPERLRKHRRGWDGTGQPRGVAGRNPALPPSFNRATSERRHSCPERRHSCRLWIPADPRWPALACDHVKPTRMSALRRWCRVAPGIPAPAWWHCPLAPPGEIITNLSLRFCLARFRLRTDANCQLNKRTRLSARSSAGRIRPVLAGR